MLPEPDAGHVEPAEAVHVQVAPDSAFFYWPNDLLATVWPTEDYQLVEARVPTELPETDLFAGIPADKEPTS